MKKALAWLLVLAMTAALAIGGTLAYLTDTDEDVNVMTVGQVKIDQLEYERVDVETENDKADVQEFHDNKPLIPAVTEKGFDYVPGDSYVDWEQIGKDGYSSEIWDPTKINNEVDKMVFVKNKGDFDAYVRTVIAFEAGNYKTIDEFDAKMHLNLNTTDWDWEWTQTPVKIGDGTYFIATATYNKVLAPGALTEISLSQIALDSKATNDDVAGFGDTFQILVQSQAVQADGFDDPDTALNEAFGTIPTDEGKYPFENDNPTKGVDLRKALHYYEGGTTQITGKVTNVVFGLNADNADIVDNYEGTLVDVEQDIPVYAYYVPNGSNYNVYVLANDDIYAPAESKELFKDMSALTEVDTGNLDVSRTTNMYRMFQNCGSLKNIDVSDWDTSNVTVCNGMFWGCGNLATLDVSGWDTGKVTDMYAMFFNCKTIDGLDVSNWDTGAVTDMKFMFRDCTALRQINAANWDVSNVKLLNQFAYRCSNLEYVGADNWKPSSATDMGYMFAEAVKLTTVNTTNWDVSNVTTMYRMFNGCLALEEVDVSKWDVSKVQNFDHMFAGIGSNAFDMNLKKLDVSNWNPESVTTFAYMFYGCAKLSEIDMGGWNMPNLTTCCHMFADCTSLKSADVTDWSTPSLICLDAMFNDCRSLTEVDMSSFDTADVLEFSQMFEQCHSLQRVIGMEKWVTTNGQDFSEMFYGCGSLKEVNFSGFDTNKANVKHIASTGAANWMFQNMLTGCSRLEKITFGSGFSFDGDGSATGSQKFVMPSATNVEGWDGNWYNAETGAAYKPGEVPELTAATYVAVNPNPAP